MGVPAAPSRKFSGLTSPWTKPLACSRSRMAIASTAMQATISWLITCPCVFQTSHRLGPSMSITMM